MNCEKLKQHIYAFLDDEISTKDSLEIKKHLKTCLPCQNEIQIEADLKEDLSETFSTIRAPSALWTKISDDLSRVDRITHRRFQKEWFTRFQPRYGFALAVCLIFLIGVAIWFPKDSLTTDYPITAETVNDHMTYLVSEREVDISTSDPEVLSEWFKNKIDFALHVPRYARKQYELDGGRLCYLLKRRLVSLNYKKGKHMVSLYIMDGSGIQLSEEDRQQLQGRDFFITRHKGYQNVMWQEDGSIYAAVSDIQEEALINFALKGAKKNLL